VEFSISVALTSCSNKILESPASRSSGETQYMAREISDTGIIAGGYEFGTAWMFTDGAYHVIGTLPGRSSSEAWGVNDQGDAAGTADPRAFFTYTPFFYDAAADEIVRVAPQGSRGWDVNNAGQVTGHVARKRSAGASRAASRCSDRWTIHFRARSATRSMRTGPSPEKREIPRARIHPGRSCSRMRRGWR